MTSNGGSAAQPWQLDITGASRLIAARKLGVTEYTRSLLERIATTDPALRAWQLVDEASALAAARAADRDITRGRLRGPLHGIPFGVKDVIDTAGVATEGGSRAYTARIPGVDSAVVRSLREQGAILLGKTVTHEIAYGQNVPPTQNPWRPGRYPGGSSAGSGVAVAVGSAPGCLGTDTAGSVRNPASVNGLVGLRPTTGVIDLTGMMHLTRRLDQIGPITRTIEDCSVLLDGMLSPEGRRRLNAAEGGTLRIGVDFEHWREAGVTDQVSDAVRLAVKQLTETGVEVVEVSLPELRLGLPVTLLFCLFDASREHRAALNERPDAFAVGTRVMLELGHLVTENDLLLARQARSYLRRRIRETFLAHDLAALVSPTLASTPPPLGQLAADLTRDGAEADLSSALVLLSPANVCGLPGLSVPCGIADGMPIGLHLLGRPFADRTLLALAGRFEAAAGWRGLHPPCWYDASPAVDGGPDAEQLVAAEPLVEEAG
jgi:Asp-tRNA(Asn)/Glu-tRNA(Gln) amidotransferase A subunit family amidase